MRCVWILALLAACEPRVAEPDPGAHDKPERPAIETATAMATATATATAMATATASSRLEPVMAGRCVWRTPDQPMRPAPPKGPDPRCPADPTGPPKLRHGSVRAAGLDATVAVEIAEHDADRQRGLMYRTKLAENEGMLFVFEDEDNRAFWMRNTCLPLDMLFIGSDGVVVGIQENVPTLNDDSYRPGDCPARYVLEVNAGWARRHGVKAGQRLVFDGI